MLPILVLVTIAAVCSGISFPSPNGNGVNWAVLIAGSNTWINYRHQADICHSYQVLHEHGFPDERIIVFMYDDIATNPSNPTPGVIINQPNGPNVYEGVPKDYTGLDVTPQNFMTVLQGGNPGVGSNKTLNSTSDDNVFIFFDDHGGPGIIAFPSEMMTSAQLISTLEYMYNHSMYNQLVFYMEACESGSMFHQLLPHNWNIYATTAADPTHSSYACYYNSTLQTYLGDVYSVNWMQNSDHSDLATETLEQQYLIVKNETNTSIVCNYGEFSLASNFVGNFQGPEPSSSSHNYPAPPHPSIDAVDSRDVRMQIAKNRLAVASSLAEITSLQAEIVVLQMIESKTRATYKSVLTVLLGSEEKAEAAFDYHAIPSDMYCIDIVMPTFHKKCINMTQNDYALKYAYTLSNMCMTGIPGADIAAAIVETCKSPVVF